MTDQSVVTFAVAMTALSLMLLFIVLQQRHDIESLRDSVRVHEVQIDSLTKNKAWRVHR
jgi:hypothetical protein